MTLVMVLTEEMIKELPLITEEELKENYYGSNEEIMAEARKEFLKKESVDE